MSATARLNDRADTLLFTVTGRPDATEAEPRSYPMAERAPLTDAVRDRTVLVFNSRDEMFDAYPDLPELAWQDWGALGTIPVASDAEALGVLALAWPIGHSVRRLRAQLVGVRPSVAFAGRDPVGALRTGAFPTALERGVPARRALRCSRPNRGSRVDDRPFRRSRSPGRTVRRVRRRRARPAARRCTIRQRAAAPRDHSAQRVTAPHRCSEVGSSGRAFYRRRLADALSRRAAVIPEATPFRFRSTARAVKS